MTSLSAQYDDPNGKNQKLSGNFNPFAVFNNGETNNPFGAILRYVVKYQEALKKNGLNDVMLAGFSRLQNAWSLIALQNELAAPAIEEKKSWLQNAFDNVSDTVSGATQAVGRVFTSQYTPRTGP